MRQVNEKQIETTDNKLTFEVAIKKVIEYKNFFLVLVRERKEVPNNIIAYDYAGNELWRINDIVKAKIARGYDNMEKKSEDLLEAYCELGIIYEIDLDRKQVNNKKYLR